MKKVVIRILFLLFIAVFNPPVLGKLAAVDGVIDNIVARVLLWAFTIILSFFFFLLVKKPERLIGYFSEKFKNFILVILAVFLALIFVELILRVKSKLLGTTAFHIDNYEYAFSFKTNSQGFRDSEFTKEKNKGTIRVFLIGDSFVWGQVRDEDTIDSFLEKKYREAGINCEVYNFGKGNEATPYYLKVAKRFKDYSPDAVIVSLYVDNDIHLPPINLLSFYKEKIRRILLHSRAIEVLYRFADKINSYFWIKKCKDRFYKGLFYRGKINWHIIERGILAGDNQESYDHLTEIFKMSRFVKKNILAIKEIYKDIPFLLVVNPSQHQVSTKYFALLKRFGYVYHEDKVVDRKLQDAIISWADKNKIDYLDILPAMRKNPEEFYFYRIDPHYNVLGNYLVANKIYNKLNEMGILRKAEIKRLK